MKKLLLIIGAALMLTAGANAQTPVRYHGEVNAGYSIGVGQFPQDRVNFHVINGVRVGQYFSAGVGLGIDLYHEMDQVNYKNYVIMPLFLNLKGYLPVKGNVSPFLSLDLGVGMGLTKPLNELSGLLFSPAIGFAFKTTQKSAFLLSFGYNVQQLSESGASLNMNAVTIKVGYQF